MWFQHGRLWVAIVGHTKTRREIEPKWVSEYIVTQYPKHKVRLRCPLGPVPETTSQGRAFRSVGHGP